jgi:hypothetical protein
MHLVRYVLGWLVSPRQLLGFAGLCAAGGLLWGYATVHENASRTLALRQGPPPAAAIEDYRGPVHRGPAGEVVLHARADLSAPLVLTLPRDGARAVAVPLFPLGGGEAALGAILVALEEGAEMPAAGSLAALAEDGHVAVNGREIDAGDFELLLAGALAVGGRSVGDRFVAVEPYLDGREAALQPVADAGHMWLLPILAAFGLALGAFRRSLGGGVVLRRRRAATAVEPRPRVAPAPGTKAAHFTPLPRQEEVNEADVPAGPGVTAMLLGLLAAALRAALRGAAGLLRVVRDGVVELRSPR